MVESGKRQGNRQQLQHEIEKKEKSCAETSQ